MKRTSYFPKENAEAVLAAHKLSNAEARFVVSDYYAAQEMRKRHDMQIRHLGDKAAASNLALLQLSVAYWVELEQTLQRALGKFAKASPVGRWMLAQYGVGPVITAGMLAHLDIERAPTAGHFWSFSNLNPTQEWKKGEKRPYCAAMKQLCYHLGECFKRTHTRADSFYGKLYESRKELLVERNKTGFNAERAKTFKTQSAEVRKKLADGQLPDGNLDRQACNFAAKIFLSHLHAVMFWDKYGKAPPKPFGIAILGHAHEIRIPHTDMFPGFEEAYYGGGKFLEAAE